MCPRLPAVHRLFERAEPGGAAVAVHSPVPDLPFVPGDPSSLHFSELVPVDFNAKLDGECAHQQIETRLADTFFAAASQKLINVAVAHARDFLEALIAQADVIFDRQEGGGQVAV